MSSRTRKGKVARLPFEIRETLNNMIRDGATAADLNDHIVSKGFAKLNATNWTNWRKGGYQDWLKDQARIDAIRDKHETIRRELEAGGFSVLDKAIYEVAQNLADSELDPAKVASAVAALKTAVTGSQRVEILSRRAHIAEQALAMAKQKFQRETCELFIKWHTDQRASQILDDVDASNEDRIEHLGELIFGEDW